MCVSLICTKVSAFAAAGAGVPALVAPSARGTPPATVQTTAAPLQAARQLNALRRAGLLGAAGSCVLIEGSSVWWRDGLHRSRPTTASIYSRLRWLAFRAEKPCAQAHLPAAGFCYSRRHIAGAAAI